MNDRVSKYPGRVKLTNVQTGAVAYYDTERADEPTVPGTGLVKANLLTDETASALSLYDSGATVNDAFLKLANYISRLESNQVIYAGEAENLYGSTFKVTIGRYTQAELRKIGNRFTIYFDQDVAVNDDKYLEIVMFGSDSGSSGLLTFLSQDALYNELTQLPKHPVRKVSAGTFLDVVLYMHHSGGTSYYFLVAVSPVA